MAIARARPGRVCDSPERLAMLSIGIMHFYGEGGPVDEAAADANFGTAALALPNPPRFLQLRRIATGRMSHLCLKGSELLKGQNFTDDVRVNEITDRLDTTPS